MPNWVFNGLSVSGDRESMTKMVEQLNRPFVLLHDTWDTKAGKSVKKKTIYSEPVFAFHNIYSYLDAEITEGQYTSQRTSVADFNATGSDIWKNIHAELETGTDWYSFNNREWGTKWDVGVSSEDEYPDTNMEEFDNGDEYLVHYNFNTAWSPPVPAIMKLSAQYPKLLFTLSYEEETGWGGEMEFVRGYQISDSSYGWQCNECDHTENDSPWCETCEYEICPSCNYGEVVDECQTHSVKSEP